MKILLGGMHRSGINAVGRWLLRQSSLKGAPLKTIHGDWVEGNGLDYLFISQINHPEHENYMDFVPENGVCEVANPTYNAVMTIERESYQRIEEIALRPEFNIYRTVIVVREFKNWLASVCKMQGNYRVDILDIAKYKSHLIRETVCDISGHCVWRPWYIYYDRWCVDAEYRKDICSQLNLKYTNCGFRDVASNGGGSSFDGQDFDGQAHKMNTSERWKEYINNPFYRNMLAMYPKVLQESNERFEVVYGKV